MNFKLVIHDGGKSLYNPKAKRDCVTRAIAIALGKNYKEVAEAIDKLALSEKITKKKKKKSSSADGVFKRTYHKYLRLNGWYWTPTMGIGTGCKVHLKADELPSHMIIARVSKHLVACHNGNMYDLADHSRNGTRCVYGYFSKNN